MSWMCGAHFFSSWKQLLRLVKPVRDHRLAQVAFRHGNHIEEDARHLDLLVVEFRARDDGAVLREPHGGFGGLAREFLERLVNRHALRAGDDPLAGGEFGILAGDDDFACQSLLGERLDRAARGAVVAREDRIERQRARGRGGLGDRGIGDLLGVLGFPILRPILMYDLDRT